MSEPLKVLVLASKPAGRAPGQRFRFEQWSAHLAARHNITIRLLPFESEQLAAILNKPGYLLQKSFLVARDFMRRAGVLSCVDAFDAVVVHREAALFGPAIYERLIAWTRTPIIFDFDDAIWIHQPGSSIFSRLHFLGKTRTIARLAAAVSCGNEYLATFARKFNRNVFVIPTTIELGHYQYIEEPTSDHRFIVCWSGSNSTLRHLEGAREALELVANRVPLVVKIICNEPPKWTVAGAEIQFVPWSQENEARDIGESHAGIMPLPDDEFACGKCGLKALQAMATGRPVVISPVGMNSQLIESGENGFLASSTDDYVDKLLQLAASPELRQRLGSAGRRTVEKYFSAEIGAERFALTIRSAIQQVREYS